jgi:hypothetical protein
MTPAIGRFRSRVPGDVVLADGHNLGYIDGIWMRASGYGWAL